MNTDFSLGVVDPVEEAGAVRAVEADEEADGVVLEEVEFGDEPGVGGEGGEEGGTEVVEGGFAAGGVEGEEVLSH